LQRFDELCRKAGTKIDFAKRLIASLAYLVVHQGDAAGLVCASQKAVFDVPPRRNPAHLQNILETLEKAEPRGDTGLISVLHDLAEKIRRRALVIVFSDFFCDPEELLSCFQHLRFQKQTWQCFICWIDGTRFKFDRPCFVDLELARPGHRAGDDARNTCGNCKPSLSD
jgi:hypothetical protein